MATVLQGRCHGYFLCEMGENRMVYVKRFKMIDD